MHFSLETNGRLMELNHTDGQLYVNYGDRLVTLLREVRQLTSLGFSIPNKIDRVAKQGQQFYKYGVILKQVCLPETTDSYKQCETETGHLNY